MPTDATSLNLTYEVAPATLTQTWFEEYYTVYWATDISTYAAIDGSPQIKPGAIIPQAVVNETIDNMLLSGTTVTNVQTVVNSGSPDEINISGSGTVYSEDPTSGNIMANITNNNTFNYGCSEISVSRAGIGAQSYNGSSSPNLVMDKTFSISPTTIASSQSTSVTFYFEPDEINGWIAATGLTVGDIVAGRGNATSVEETATLTLGSFGSNITLTGNFTGLNGTYYFGTLGAFSSTCVGGVKTWNGSAWSPPGAPGATNTVVINGTYDTSADGDLIACELTINPSHTLTINAGDFISVNGNITANGTLIVEHQGSVVQTDDTASVIKNPTTGTINVNVTTPVLRKRDFMLMGSPMTTESKSGVWDSAFLVLDFHSQDFRPHTGVPGGGTNFADDNGDFYLAYTGGINPGEGYVVRPQSGYNDPTVPPAGRPFDFTYEQGTLNNGLVTFTNHNNGNALNPNGTPNMIANPHPSAIDADLLMGPGTPNPNFTVAYFWEHITPPGAGLPVSNLRYDMDDFSYYNAVTGIGIPAANDAGGLSTPTNVISTAQGFGVPTVGAPGTTGSIIFNNSMRLTTGNSTLRNTLISEKITLELRESQYGLGSFAAVAFSESASNGYDEGMDTNRLATIISIYSHLQDGSQELGIQALSAFENTVKVPVGFSSQVEEQLSYTISIQNIEGDNLSQAPVYLVDNYLNIITDLKQSDYTFRSGKGEFSSRFTLIFERDPVLGIGNNSLDQVQLYPNPTRGILNIVSPTAVIEKIEVYDVLGRAITTKRPNLNVTTLDMSLYNTSVYFVSITTADGTITKRVVKN